MGVVSPVLETVHYVSLWSRSLPWLALTVNASQQKIRGNVNGDGSDAIAVNDLTYLVAYIFQSGPNPPCPSEGDVNGNGSIAVNDLTYLVAYLFQSGPTPPTCP